MYREEYPRPDFVRTNWMNLNGTWDFNIINELDYSTSLNLTGAIEVPFCIESELSNVKHLDFISKAAYRREFILTNIEEKTILHFGAVFYEAQVYINKEYVGSHKGGYTPFSLDISAYVLLGSNIIDVLVKSDVRDLSIPSGKQSLKQDSFFCFYTRSTGIWQTVWLEFLNKKHLTIPKITPKVEDKSINFKFKEKLEGDLNIKIYYKQELVKSDSFLNPADVTIKLEDIVLWDINKGNLYDIHLELRDEDTLLDSALTYCAFRTIELKGRYFYLNNKQVILKQVLDQGYYPDGIYTPSTVEKIEEDINFAISFGFNGARPHMKVFDPYYFYFADKKGFLTFGEFANWSCDFRQNKKGYDNLMTQWQEVLDRDYNHPSIIGWCPLNETWRMTKQKCDYLSQINLVNATRAVDSSRIIIGSSGGDLYAGDIWDCHSYEHNPKKLQAIIKNFWKNKYYFLTCIYCYDRSKRLKKSTYKNMPQFLSEYGGFTYMTKGKTWGYKKAIETEEEFVKNIIELTEAALSSPIMGICYTQLYDVEQEQNGLLKYDRTHKLKRENIEKIRECLTKEREEKV